MYDLMERSATRPEIKVRWLDDVTVATVVGVFSAQGHADVRSALFQQMQLREARAVVIDMRAAVSVMTDSERRAVVYEAATARNAIKVPIAVVTPEALFDGITSQCALAWRHGRMWVPFFAYDDGLHWARSRRAARPQRAQPGAAA